MKRLFSILLIISLAGLSPGCAAFHKAPATGDQQQQKLAQIKKAADIIKGAGVVVEQALNVEAELVKAGVVPAATDTLVKQYINGFATQVLLTLNVLDDLAKSDVERRAAVQSLLNAAKLGAQHQFPDPATQTRIAGVFAVVEVILVPALTLLP